MSTPIRNLIMTLCLAATPLISACPACDAVEQLPQVGNRAVDALRDAIDKLTANSSSWQQVLKDTVDKLSDDTEKTIRNDVQQVLDRAVAAAGIEARCGAPFIAEHVLASLKALLSQSEGQDGGTAPTPVPTACYFSPNPIRLDASPSELSVDGYDFDALPIGVLLRGTGHDVDVTPALSVSSHFQMVLDLRRVPFTKASRQLVFTWGGKEQGAVPVIQPTTPPCQIKRPPGTEGSLNAVYFRPGLVWGDAEFGSHRIKAYATASLIIEDDLLYARVSLDAQEQGGDTRAYGEAYQAVYRAPAGMRIRSLGLPAETAEFVLDSAGPDGVAEYETGSGPVQGWKFELNNKGDDVGAYTAVTVSFNQIHPELEEDGRDAHCINQAPPLRSLVVRGHRTAYDFTSGLPTVASSPALTYQQQLGLRFASDATVMAVGSFPQGSTVTLRPTCSAIAGLGGNLVWIDGPCRGSSAAACLVTINSAARQNYSFACQ